MGEQQDCQWPDNICSGDIRYGLASNYNGFYLADVAHGIPTIGAVSPTEPVTIRGQSVHVFNYPGQTEAVAAQLVHRWNCHLKLLEALKSLLDYDEQDAGCIPTDAHRDAQNVARAAIAKAEAGQ